MHLDVPEVNDAGHAFTLRPQTADRRSLEVWIEPDDVLIVCDDISPILPPRNGFLFLDKERFHQSFAGDVPADEAADAGTKPNDSSPRDSPGRRRPASRSSNPPATGCVLLSPPGEVSTTGWKT